MPWRSLKSLIGNCLLAVAVCSAQGDTSRRGLVLLPGNDAPLSGKTYALLIGVSDYQKDPPVASLKYAHKDAEAMAELLKSPLGGELKEPDQLRLLTNQRATRAAIDEAMANFVAPHASPDNTLILFVAAHGVYLKSEEDPVTHRIIEKQPYILTYESNYQDPKTTGYPMDEFRRLIAGQAVSYGRVFVFVDVCHAENIAGMAGGAELEPAVQRVFNGEVGDLELLLATHARKFAYESENFGGGHGAFSYSLIAGMNGLAATEGRSFVTFADLQAYVVNRVRDLTRNEQYPDGRATNLDTVVVRDIGREGVKLGPAEKIAEGAVRDVKNQRGFSKNRPTIRTLMAAASAEAFDQAIASGRLLPEDLNSAAALLAQMRQDPNQSPDDVRSREQRLYVALADQGQQIMSRYLEGDQVPQTKADFERCARLFEEAGRLMAGNPVFDRSRELFCRGRALIFDRQYDQAETLLNASIQLDPRRAYAYNALGIAELERSARTGETLNRAVDAFRMAMRFAPYWAYPVHNLALLESERGNYNASIDLYQRGMQIGPLFSYLPYNLGLLNLRLGDYGNAARWLEKARQLSEDARIKDQPGPWVERSEIWNALGTVARARRQEDRALDYFQKALADNPESANARQNVALILARRKEYSKADALWLQNLSRTPKFLPSHIAYAESLASRGSLAGAAGLYEQILVDEPNYVGAREALARLYLKQQQPAKALVHLEAALKISPNPEILELRGDAEFALGQRNSAEADWNQALQRSDDRAAKSRLRRKLSPSR